MRRAFRQDILVTEWKQKKSGFQIWFKAFVSLYGITWQSIKKSDSGLTMQRFYSLEACHTPRKSTREKIACAFSFATGIRSSAILSDMNKAILQK